MFNEGYYTVLKTTTTTTTTTGIKIGSECKEIALGEASIRDYELGTRRGKSVGLGRVPERIYECSGSPDALRRSDTFGPDRKS